MTRRYGRARHGERVRENAPAGHWRTLTLLGAITVDGLLATMTIESPTDGEAFLALFVFSESGTVEVGQLSYRF